MNHLDLFTGVGGFMLAAQWAGIRTVACAEIAPFPARVLARRFPSVPNLGDVRGIAALADSLNTYGIDIITAGFPCQDISLNGKGAGIEGDRSGLFWEIPKIARAVSRGGRLPWLLLENVPALRSRGFDSIAVALEEIGYTVSPCVVGAHSFGGDHQRERAWIVAHPKSVRMEGVWPSWHDEPRPLGQPFLPLRNRDGEWEVEPDVRRTADGIPNRLDRLEALGNAICPQVAYPFLRFIHLTYLKATT